MDWFERLVGFREAGYAETQAKMEVVHGRLRSRVSGQSHGIGTLAMDSLMDLRKGAGGGLPGRLRVGILEGDVGAMHRLPEFEGAVFQVASQFNMLEMPGPDVTPEDGVTGYAWDKTQGPACAMAAGAATVYRNYFVPVGEQVGQTRGRQLDGLAELGEALAERVGMPVASLWRMRNGYALCSAEGLAAVAGYLGSAGEEAVDALRGMLRVGVHTDVEVTDAGGATVSQVFCAALPVAYSRVPQAEWKAFATLVLEATYEATIWAAVANARRGRSNVVLLTSVGGGVFGNDAEWVYGAMRRALGLARGFALDVRVVSYGAASVALRGVVGEFEG